MKPILFGSPLLSAIACFLDSAEPVFARFCRQAGLERPFHLSLNPKVWADYQAEHGEVDMDEILEFQGDFVDLDTLRRWDKNSLICYGNHLFEHWNAAALNPEDLRKQYLLNEAELSSFSSRINLFAFTNGQPNTCFTERDVKLLKAAGAGRVFSTAGGVNFGKEQFVLGRIALGESDKTVGGLWFRIGRSVFDNRKVLR